MLFTGEPMKENTMVNMQRIDQMPNLRTYYTSRSAADNVALTNNNSDPDGWTYETVKMDEQFGYAPKTYCICVRDENNVYLGYL